MSENRRNKAKTWMSEDTFRAKTNDFANHPAHEYVIESIKEFQRLDRVAYNVRLSIAEANGSLSHEEPYWGLVYRPYRHLAADTCKGLYEENMALISSVNQLFKLSDDRSIMIDEELAFKINHVHADIPANYLNYIKTDIEDTEVLIINLKLSLDTAIEDRKVRDQIAREKKKKTLAEREERKRWIADESAAEEIRYEPPVEQPYPYGLLVAIAFFAFVIAGVWLFAK